MNEVTIVVGTMPWQKEHALALAAGLAVHGIKSTFISHSGSVRTKVAACWSWRVGQMLKRYNVDVLVMERGYIGDRFRWTSLGWNGLNGYGHFPERDDESRFNVHFKHLMQPWKESGEYVLIIGQVPGDASLRNKNLTSWYCDAAKSAEVYGLPVYFRPHPETLKRSYRQQIPGTKTLSGSLDEALSKAHVVITFNSNVGVDAVMAGCPAIVTDKGSMAWNVAAHQIGERLMPDRAQWVTRLAWCQWTIDEIRSGAAWEVVGKELRTSNVAA